MKKAWLLFIFGLLLIDASEILKVYYIMPMPGSQLYDRVELAWNINHYLWVVRILALLLTVYSFMRILQGSGIWKKVLAGLLFFLTAGIFYLSTFVMLADKIFLQQQHTTFTTVGLCSTGRERLVTGIVQNGIAKAYPIYILGYHHQVRDSLGTQPMMVTYCTVCRTGRVYVPEVDGHAETFRLVGMDHFNAMFEDATTHSWWRQATGECCAGPLRGKWLREFPSEQMTLGAWEQLYPQSLVLEPDAAFTQEYNSLKGYDDGSLRGALEGTDTASGHPKSWMAGIVTAHGAKAYDWNLLKQLKVINDTVGTETVVLVMEKDHISFHAFYRQAGDSVLHFTFDSEKNTLTDDATLSLWNMRGECTEGPMKGTKLKPVKAYQEFYHSFMNFHPQAGLYRL